jgi:hypothetical protein
MAYAKMPKVVTDFALGYQSLNVLRGNFDAQHTAWVAQHGSTEPQYDIDRNPIYPFPQQRIGHHNTPLIPRDVISVTAPSSYAAGLLGSALFGYTSGNFIVSGQRISTGIYFFGVSGLTLWYATALCKVTSTSTQALALCRSQMGTGATSGSSPLGVSIATYTISGGVLTLADYNFAFTLYGTV